ncbi:MAG: ADOP family duplicated permease [Bryobacteraceae bacterium]
MQILHRAGKLWRNFFDRARVDQDLTDELRSYQDMLADENARSGLNLPDALRRAAVDTGGIELIKEQVREVRMGFSVDTLSRDVRFAVRTLFRQRTFSLTVLSLLAIGVAGTTAIFSVFNGLYLQPLPFDEPERLVNLDEKAPQWNLERTGVAYPDFHAWREGNRSFEAVSVVQDIRPQISDESRAETLEGARATHDVLQVLRIRPQLGRWFLPDEDKPNGPRVAVLGHQLWLTRFGGSSGAVGQTIRIDSQPFTIIGVLPAGVDFPNRTEIWMPLGMDRDTQTGWFLDGVARLKPGVTPAMAQEDLLRVHKGMIEQRKVNETTSPTVYPLRDWYVGDFRQATTLLLGTVGLVLLIACANIAGIMLARGSARMREMGVRTALGAPRSRIVRQLLTESLVLGVAGGILGTALGFQGLRGLLLLMPPNQVPGWVRFDLDWRFLTFCLAVSIGSAVMFGLWPALNSSRADIRTSLQDAGPRTSESAGRRRSLQVLITAEIALAAVLLTAAGLLIQAFRKVERVDKGFRADNILTYQVALPASKYQKPEQRRVFAEELAARHRLLPGVQAAAVASATPLGRHSGNFFKIENAPPKRPGEPNPVILQRIVSPGYLEAMGMTLRAGRTFTDADGRSDGSAAAIVNETFARLSWANQDPIGKRIRFGGGDDRRWYKVVGVIADVKDYGLDQPSRPSVYLPFAQNGFGFFAVVVRTSVDPSSLTSAAREVLRRMDPDLAMARVTTMAQRLSESMWLRRTYSLLVAVFAGIAVVLVVSGLYGVISYTVSQRRREIAIRVALGAGQGRILSGVLKEAVVMASFGLAFGVACGWWSSRFFESLLFGVRATDPATYVTAVAIVGFVALIASLLPAISAARTAPMSALRVE